MANSFLLPKDPRLSLGMLLPSPRRGSVIAPVGGSRTYYLFWARNAIYHGLTALKIGPGDNVLVPSFHCTSVVEPMLRHGAQVKFYNIENDLSPKISDIEEKIDRNTRALFVIHYFGFPQKIEAFKQLARRYGLFLIEDCAHVLTGNAQNGAPLGSFGDISIFSWRKFLPLYDGGQLVINNPELEVSIPADGGSLLFSFKVANNILDKLIDGSDHKLVQKMTRISRIPSVIVRRLSRANGHASKALDVSSYDLDFDLASVNLKMSALSKYILRNIDLTDVVAKRRDNYLRLLDALKSFAGVTCVYPDLKENLCPWVFPLLVHGSGDFHLRLRASGIPAFTWSGVIHPSLPLDQFPKSRFLYDNLVFLPIHQSLNEKQIAAMIYVLQKELETSSPRVERFSASASARALRAS